MPFQGSWGASRWSQQAAVSGRAISSTPQDTGLGCDQMLAQELGKGTGHFLQKKTYTGIPAGMGLRRVIPRTVQ